MNCVSDYMKGMDFNCFSGASRHPLYSLYRRGSIWLLIAAIVVAIWVQVGCLVSMYSYRRRSQATKRILKGPTRSLTTETPRAALTATQGCGPDPPIRILVPAIMCRREAPTYSPASAPTGRVPAVGAKRRCKRARRPPRGRCCSPTILMAPYRLAEDPPDFGVNQHSMNSSPVIMAMLD